MDAPVSAKHLDRLTITGPNMHALFIREFARLNVAHAEVDRPARSRDALRVGERRRVRDGGSKQG